VNGLAKGDVVRVVRDREEDQLWVTEVPEDGGHWTSRVLPADAASLDTVAARFAALGCDAHPGFGLVPVDVPPAADSSRVERELERGERDGTWEYNRPVEVSAATSWSDCCGVDSAVGGWSPAGRMAVPRTDASTGIPARDHAGQAGRGTSTSGRTR
jgi:hypothetical protein